MTWRGYFQNMPYPGYRGYCYPDNSAAKAPYLIDSDVLIDISRGKQTARKYIDALPKDGRSSLCSAATSSESAVVVGQISTKRLGTHPGGPTPLGWLCNGIPDADTQYVSKHNGIVNFANMQTPEESE